MGVFLCAVICSASKQREHEDRWGGTKVVSSVDGLVACKDRCLCMALIRACVLLNILLLEWGKKWMFDFIRWKVFCPVRVSFEEFCMFVFFDQKKKPNWIYVNVSFLFLLIIRMLQQKLHKKTHLYPIQERNKLHQLQRNLPEKKKKWEERKLNACTKES